MYRIISIIIFSFAFVCVRAQVKVDLPETKAQLRLLEMAAEKGDDASAEFRLGYAYLMGVNRVVGQNTKKGVSWLKKAADLGSAEACLVLHQLYPNNKDNYGDRARTLFERDGSGYAYYCLAELLKGNLRRSITYLAAADRLGYAPAGPALQAMLKARGGRLQDYASETEITQLVAGKSVADNQPKAEYRPAKRITAVDVDEDTPRGTTPHPNTVAVLIGNEHYDKMPQVTFAANDKQSMEQYCRLTLGIPEENIVSYTDAGLADMNGIIKDIEKRLKLRGSNANVIFYYAGHGQCSTDGKEPFLVPRDGKPDNSDSWLSVNKLYAQLSALPAERVTVFMDACFSGADRAGGLLDKGARGVRAVKPVKPAGSNLVVFAATQKDQTAHPYEKKSHGMFTYFLLKKLQETAGQVTLGTLAEYIQQGVYQTCLSEGTPSQEPTTTSSYRNWQNALLCP